MGQKVHPYGFRLGVIKDWTSTWFAERRRYTDYLNTDIAVRAFLRKKLAHASVSRIQIERPAHNARIVIHTARPGIVIGKKGEDIESLRKQISQMMGIPAHLSVEEIRKPELDSYLVAESVAGLSVTCCHFRYTGFFGANDDDLNIVGVNGFDGIEVTFALTYRAV